MLNGLSEAIVSGDLGQTERIFNQLLHSRVPVETIISRGIIVGMNLVNEKFQSHEFSIADVISSGEAVKIVLEKVKKLPAYCKKAVKGKAVIGTVEGDVHSIGKNLVALALEIKGIEVIDLGVDVTPERFIKAVIKHTPQFVCMSCLLSVTMFKMKETIMAIEEAGLRDQVKIIIGGTSVTEQFATEIGADVYLENGLEIGVKACELLESWDYNEAASSRAVFWQKIADEMILEQAGRAFYEQTGVNILIDSRQNPELLEGMDERHQEKTWENVLAVLKGQEQEVLDIFSRDDLEILLLRTQDDMYKVYYPILFKKYLLGWIVTEPFSLQAVESVQLPSMMRMLCLVGENISSRYKIEVLEKQLSQNKEKMLEALDLQEELKIDLHEATLNRLQCQTNPHFLFNSLNIGARLAFLENAAKTEHFLYTLSGLLRYTLKNIKKAVTVGEEMNIIKDYLEIQQLRFQDRLTVAYEINEHLLEAMIPCMALQPLVENAIVHGMEPCEQQVMLKITLQKNDPGVLFMVEDNGKGIDYKQMEEITRFKINRSWQGHSTGLGLSNVQQRLQLFFGSDCGLQITNKENGGTRASVYFRLIASSLAAFEQDNEQAFTINYTGDPDKGISKCIN